MISTTARDSIEELQHDGLSPTVEDIIRLNALGLKLEFEAKKSPRDATDYLPRIAKISDTVSFRQPTIGHEIWISKIRRMVDEKDFQTSLAVQAFALSRASADLPDADDIKSVKVAVDAFCADCKDFTREQIIAAIEYVTVGPSPTACETAPASHREPDGFDFEDWKHCVACGVLLHGKAALFGASFADLERLTREQLEALTRMAYVFNHIENPPDYVSIARGDYFATLDEIRERLTKEKEARANG